MLYSTGDQSSTPSGLREEKIVTELRLKPFVTKIIMKDYKKILIFTNKTETAEKLHLLLNKLGEETELLSSSLDHDWKRNVIYRDYLVALESFFIEVISVLNRNFESSCAYAN